LRRDFISSYLTPTINLKDQVIAISCKELSTF